MQIVNFGFVPPAYQVLFSNMVGLAWNVWLSFVAHRSHAPGSPHD